MAPDFPVVVRLPRVDHADEEATFVLLHVSPDGHRPLDLKLIGTENETVFAVSLEHGKTSSDPKAHLSQEQWEAILASVLLRIVPDEEHTEIIKGVEAVAKVESKATKLTITIQRRIEGITQRLGTLALRATDDEEIDMFEWCASAVASKNKTNEELKVLRATLSGKDEQVKKLEDSFAELITLKNSHEKSLLEKFSLLLNEKKLKIRDQQRLLASSNVDPAKLQALEATRRDSRSRSAGPSRKGKRKVEEKEDSDSDEGFEKMEVDKEEAAPDSEDEDRRTPDAESTADDTESEGEAPEPQSPPRKKTVNESKASERNARADSFDSPPPQRSLPSRNPAPPPLSAPIDGSETESDDDEL